jgi:hypothetical protein
VAHDVSNSPDEMSVEPKSQFIEFLQFIVRQVSPPSVV